MFAGESGRSARVQRGVAVVALAVAAAIAAVWLLWPEGTVPRAEPAPPPAPQAVVAGTVLKDALCHRPATRPFVPTRITVPHVTTNAEVLALPRDANNVPQAPPISSTGKTQFAWDAPTIKPGEAQGNVLINAHTWPDGTALGNHLLDNVQVGHTIIVRGQGGAELCYTVTKRDVIVASGGSWEYYAKDGPPQLALIVCSPPRLGPGNWLHRTIWYASPWGTPQARAARASAAS
ncbi:MAG: class F sortase [Nocardioidaceae bacterium]|nr:class F sortase [Nocardioidaceae bacterium]